MTMLAETKEGRVLSLADYEARIQLYKEQIGTGYIGIGRTLNEAKEAKVVPHGQWESWVTQTTGLTPRQAQRCMQAATEIREGSAMARLEMSKALMLLGSGLDEDTREEIAERAAEEGATVKELREELKKAKLQVVQETGAAMEIRDALRKAEEDRASLEQQMRATVSAYQARMDEEVGKAYQRGVSEKAVGLEKEIRKEFQGAIETLKQKYAQADRARQEILDNSNKASDRTTKVIQEKEERIRQLEEAYKMTGDALEAARETVPEAAALELEALKRNQADLLAAAEEAEKRAADAEAELEAMRAGGAGQPDPAWKVIRVATDRFMTDCQLLPVTDAAGVMRDEKRISGCLDILESWIRMTRDVFAGAVAAEGAVQ